MKHLSGDSFYSVLCNTVACVKKDGLMLHLDRFQSAFTFTGYSCNATGGVYVKAYFTFICTCTKDWSQQENVKLCVVF